MSCVRVFLSISLGWCVAAGVAVVAIVVVVAVVVVLLVMPVVVVVAVMVRSWRSGGARSSRLLFLSLVYHLCFVSSHWLR